MDEQLMPDPIPAEPAANSVPAPVGAGKWEFLFAGAIALCAILLCNFIFYGGFHLGFAIAAIAAILCSAGYLLVKGHRFDWYSGSLILLSLIIAAGFGRSADGLVKLIMFLFLFTAVNLGLCLAAKQNRRSPAGALSLLDAPRAAFVMGFGGMKRSNQELVWGIKNSGTAGQKVGAVGIGLLVCIPILIIMVPMLMKADAAFEGLMDLLPEFALDEYLTSGFWGIGLGWILYSRGTQLHSRPLPTRAESRFRGINPLTVSTILTAVCLLYALYMVSQLAYLSGGFSGILPEEFTMAEYARRGFFEMAWLCVINLLLICGSIALVRKEPKAPGFIRGCCLFIGIITIFFVSTASAKMFMYIGSYGLTWLRVLTEVIMLWLALTTTVVCLWLFVPKLPYMKIVMLTAMILGAVVFWVDVDTVVARYNVTAYREGRLENVDMDHLSALGYSAVPYIHELIDDDDPKVRKQALEILRERSCTIEDFRSWNWSKAQACSILNAFHEKDDQRAYTLLRETLGIEIPAGTLAKQRNYQPEMENGQQFLCLQLTYEDATAFEALLQDAGWNQLPLPPVLQQAIWGAGTAESLFTDLDTHFSFHPKGFYLFTNLHPDASDPSNYEGLLTQSEPNFYLAIFDATYHNLYFFRLDQSAAESTV